MSATLSVSLVVYYSDMALLRETLMSLRGALERAHEAGLVSRVTLHLLDNGMADEAAVEALARSEGEDLPWLTLALARGHGNLGYGRAHNLAILVSDATYHLVINPDVFVTRDAVAEAVRFLEANPDVGLVTPDVRGPEGNRQYLCRRYPSVLVLFLRGFAPGVLRRLFRGYMESHELRHVTGDAVVKGIPLASGCFMFARGSVLRAVGGFSPNYFVYFEDFDLSLRLGEKVSLAFVPAVRVAHHGGGAARKGARHVLLFVRGALTFFRTHGWKIA